MEQQLVEAKLKLEEMHANSTTSTQMLRSEIRRLMSDRSELKQQRSDKQRTELNIERKTQVFQEMIDKLKSERYELQRQNYVLKRKFEESDRKLFDLKLKGRKPSISIEKPKIIYKEYILSNKASKVCC